MPPRLNDAAARIADAMVARAEALGLRVSRGAGGETVVDCGRPGSAEAGLHLARIAMGGLASVALRSFKGRAHVRVRTDQPLLACIGSQYAGWHLRTADGAFLMGSGPARALARREPLFDDIPHREEADRAVLVLEGQAPPDHAVAEEVATACRVPRDRLLLLHAPTGSPAGTVQIAARAIECALQKARHLGLDLTLLRAAASIAPVAPPGPDPDLEMGRANDAIRYGARVRLALDARPGVARAWADALPARATPGWDRPFRDLYEEAGRDFGHMDPGLFSPAEVVVCLRSSETFRGGRIAPDRLRPALTS